MSTCLEIHCVLQAGDRYKAIRAAYQTARDVMYGWLGEQKAKRGWLVWKWFVIGSWYCKVRTTKTDIYFRFPLIR